MSFGSRLKKLRLDKGLTQKELGDKINISDRVIGYYESGDRFPKDENTLKQISDIFSVSIDFLLDKTNVKNNSLEYGVIPEEFTDPKEAREYVGMHAIFGSEGFRLDTMDDEEVLKFANELLRQMELISYKYKK